MSVEITETLYGRRVIYTDCSEITEDNLLSVLEKSLMIHSQNKREIQCIYPALYLCSAGICGDREKDRHGAV